MKKLIIAAICMFTLAACSDNAKKNAEADEYTNLRDSLNQIIDQKEAEINDIMATFNDIQEGLHEINAAEGRVNLETSNPEKASKTDIAENLSFIKQTLELNRQRISRLQDQLRTASFNTSKMKETIHNLQSQIEEKVNYIALLEEDLKAKNLTIAEQSGKIENLNKDVNTLTETNTQQAKTVANQDKEIHTAWYVFGTKKELKEQKIMIGDDILQSDNFNKDYFTMIDIRVVKTIKLYSKHAELLTSHPAGSYTLDRDASKQYTLRITDAAKFWSISRYLVIQVK